jgi:hypothetical protein
MLHLAVYFAALGQLCPPVADYVTNVPPGAVLTAAGCYNMSEVTQVLPFDSCVRTCENIPPKILPHRSSGLGHSIRVKAHA